MKMLRILLEVGLLTLLVVPIGCTREIKVEVPENRVGVVVTNNERIEGNILKAGIHAIQYNSKVIVFNVNPKKIDFAVDFLSKDERVGKVIFSLTFVPIESRLAAYYERYNDYRLPISVQMEVSSALAELLKKYDKENLHGDEIKRLILSDTVHIEVLKYIHIQKLDSVKFEF